MLPRATLPVVLLATLVVTPPARPVQAVERSHPLHLSTTRVDVTGSDGALEVQLRSFVDDLEEAMAAESGTMRRIGTAPSAALDSALSQHCRQRLRIAADERVLPLTYVGFERVDDAVELYFTARVTPGATTVMVDQRLLLDRFPDQQNLLFLQRGEQRQSAVQRVGSAGGRFSLR